MKTKHLLGTLALLGMLAGFSSGAYAFTDNNAAPPANNAPAPLNQSGTAQTKQGSLRSNSDMRAPIFYDQNNAGFYVDPNGWSNMAYLRSSALYDRDNGNYYLDPNNTSVLNNLFSNRTDFNIAYDLSNRGYYLNMDGSSRLNVLTTNFLQSSGGMYAAANNNVNDTYFRSIGKYASQLNAEIAQLRSQIQNSAAINPQIHTLYLSSRPETRIVNARYCALSSTVSWSFEFNDTDAVLCETSPRGGNQWRIYQHSWDMKNNEGHYCQFSCIR